MDKWTSFPAPLKRKVILTAVIGSCCLLVGVTFAAFAKDIMMLLLSLARCGLSFYNAFTMYRVASKKEYEIVEGTCSANVPKLLTKFRKIKLVDEEGNETAFLLSKQSKITVGERYRFYFKKTTRLTLGNEYFDSALSSDCFLGYEKIT
jgi:hypothetical protein